mmetsp:Transcript_120997/g.342786  ORF Transcript_120997/g.342786 Transcript_120997/m.342786 type:complete len:213 (+) Transcript_120997:41-679(+)
MAAACLQHAFVSGMLRGIGIKGVLVASMVVSIALLLYSVTNDLPFCGLVAESTCLCCMGYLLLHRDTAATWKFGHLGEPKQERRDRSDPASGATPASTNGKRPLGPTSGRAPAPTSGRAPQPPVAAGGAGPKRPKEDVDEEIAAFVQAGALNLRRSEIDGWVRQCLHAIHQKRGRQGVRDALVSVAAHITGEDTTDNVIYAKDLIWSILKES